MAARASSMKVTGVVRVTNSTIRSSWTEGREPRAEKHTIEALAIIILLVAFGWWRYENFLGLFNVMSVLRYNSMFALVALGMCFVIMTGGIDLSVGSTAALGSVAAALGSLVDVLLEAGHPAGPFEQARQHLLLDAVDRGLEALGLGRSGLAGLRHAIGEPRHRVAGGRDECTAIVAVERKRIERRELIAAFDGSRSGRSAGGLHRPCHSERGPCSARPACPCTSSKSTHSREPQLPCPSLGTW